MSVEVAGRPCEVTKYGHLSVDKIQVDVDKDRIIKYTFKLVFRTIVSGRTCRCDVLYTAEGAWPTLPGIRWVSVALKPKWTKLESSA